MLIYDISLFEKLSKLKKKQDIMNYKHENFL